MFSLETSEQIDILGFLKIINCKLSYYDINNNNNNNNNNYNNNNNNTVI